MLGEVIKWIMSFAMIIKWFKVLPPVINNPVTNKKNPAYKSCNGF